MNTKFLFGVTCYTLYKYKDNDECKWSNFLSKFCGETNVSVVFWCKWSLHLVCFSVFILVTVSFRKAIYSMICLSLH